MLQAFKARFITPVYQIPNAVWVNWLTSGWAVAVFIIVVLGGSALAGLGG